MPKPEAVKANYRTIQVREEIFELIEHIKKKHPKNFKSAAAFVTFLVNSFWKENYGFDLRKKK